MNSILLKRRSFFAIPAFVLMLAGFLLMIPVISGVVKARDGWRHIRKWTADYLAREQEENAQAEIFSQLSRGSADNISVPKSGRIA